MTAIEDPGLFATGSGAPNELSCSGLGFRVGLTDWLLDDEPARVAVARDVHGSGHSRCIPWPTGRW